MHVVNYVSIFEQNRMNAASFLGLKKFAHIKLHCCLKLKRFEKRFLLIEKEKKRDCGSIQKEKKKKEKKYFFSVKG